MAFLDNVEMYYRFWRGLKKLSHNQLDLAGAREIVKRRLAAREDNFLRMLEHKVFGYARSPYLPLFKLAGCELGDIHNLLRQKGLDATLLELRQAGVYVNFEEFKCRTPIRRGSQTIEARPEDFYSPVLHGHLFAETGGTTGAGRRIPLEVDHEAEMTVMMLVTRQAHGCLDFPSLLWRGPIPDGTGVKRIINHCRGDRTPDRWFIADLKGKDKPKLSYRLSDMGFIYLMRFLGMPVPRPQPLAMDQAIIAARWVYDACREKGGCYINTTVGRSVRITGAAREAGLDLTGAVIEMGGEPATEGKVKAIMESGARCYHTYNMFEFSQMAWGCANPSCVDDMHMSMDCFGLIGYPYELPGGKGTVNALNITTLLPTAPLIMINAQIDDHGLVEHRSCGCPLEELGLTQHVSKVRSYSKLVTEGGALIGSDVVRVLEQVLPAKFGGSPTDYQLMEAEEASGITRLNLVISPKIRLADDQEALDAFWQALQDGPDSYAWVRNLWSQGKVLKVVRMEPHTSMRGKHLTLWKQPPTTG